MTADEHGLQNAVLESPDDDTTRLILADWYEENGQTSRAKFVRAQIELARLVACAAYDSDEYLAASRAVSGFPNAAYIGWVRKAGLPVAGGAVMVDFNADLAGIRDPATGTVYSLRRGCVERVRLPTKHARQVLPFARAVPLTGLQLDTGTYLGGSYISRFEVTIDRTDSGWAASADLSGTVSRRRFTRTDQFGRPNRADLFDDLLLWLHRFWSGWATEAGDGVRLPPPGTRWVTTGQMLLSELQVVTADLNPYPLSPRDAP